MKVWGYGFRTTIVQTSPCFALVNEYPFCAERIGMDEVAVGSLSVRISNVAPEGNESRACFAWMNGYGHRRPRVSRTRFESASGSRRRVALMVSLR
jgi:hypothetical protein